MTVRAKKHLGQHFLKDEHIAKSIADTLTETNYNTVLEIGPGMGGAHEIFAKETIYDARN